MKNLIFLLLIFASCSEKTETEKVGDEMRFSINIDGGEITSQDSVEINWEYEEYIEVTIFKKATGFALVWADCALSSKSKSIEVFEKKSIIRFEPSLEVWKEFYKDKKDSYIWNFWIFSTEFE